MSLPWEMVEKILLRLPVKSLFRFCAVSKSWRSMILESWFAKEYRSSGGEIIVISTGIIGTRGYFVGGLSCPPSSISDLIEDIATPIVCPIPEEQPAFLVARCAQELLCVRVGDSLYLWNPLINNNSAYRKLPNPLGGREVNTYIYSMGYDSVRDDYKIEAYHPIQNEPHQLYSLTSDSWKLIDDDPPANRFGCPDSAFVNGAFHWRIPGRIISFDVSSEKFGEVGRPRLDGISGQRIMKLTVLRGKLCLHVNEIRRCRFVLWLMEEYGVEKSWSKKFDIYWSSAKLPYVPSKPCGGGHMARRVYRPELAHPLMEPIYLYENGEILFRVFADGMNSQMFVYKGEGEADPWRIVSREISPIAFVCAQGIFSPAAVGY